MLAMRMVPFLLPWIAACAFASPRSSSGGTAGPAAEARLQQAWQALHPEKAVPAACPDDDPVRELSADLDEAPGKETALASLRYGVVLFSAAGQPLAVEELGCGPPAAGPGQGAQVIELQALRASGLSPQDLVVRSRQSGHCGQLGQWVLLHRRNAQLAPLLSVDENVDRACGSAPMERYTARIQVLAPGLLRVTDDGEVRPWLQGGSYGPPQPLHRTTVYQLQASGTFAPKPEANRPGAPSPN